MPYIDPTYMDMPFASLEESAARMLQHSPVLLAYLARSREALVQGYDQAKDFERVKEIRGQRKELQALLDLTEAKPAPQAVEIL